MFSAPEATTLTNVRPQVTNMRPSGYFLQTDGSATKQVVEPEGDAKRTIFRVTGIPGHTHTASALLDVEVTKKTISDQPVLISNALEFSTEAINVSGAEVDDNESRQTYDELIRRAQRAIEFGIGNVELKPENCKNYIDEPTRAIAEIRTLVSPDYARSASTYVRTEHLRTERDGVTPVPEQMPTVFVPILPINNMHIDSTSAMYNGQRNLHLEFWREDQNFNDWGINSEQISFTSRAITAQPAVVQTEYPVALGRIGHDVPIYMLNERGEEKRWDGTLPFDYNPVTSNYELRRRAYKIKFCPPFDFIGNGHLTYDELGGGTTAQRKLLNRTEDDEYVIFTLDTTPSNWEVLFKGGYYYLNYKVQYSSRANARVYKKPRILVKGTFSLFDGDLTSLVKGDGAGGLQNQVAQNFFGQDYLCAYHAPLVRWAAGSAVAIQGPLISSLYLPIPADAQTGAAQAGANNEFPNAAEENNFTSMWETVRRTEVLVDHDKLLMQTGVDLESLLFMMPNPLTKLGADGLTARVAAKALWEETYPVPFAAGLYPFREDYRFEHKAALDLTALSSAGAALTDVVRTFTMGVKLYNPKTVATDNDQYRDPILPDRGEVNCVYTYEQAAIVQGGTDAKKLNDAFVSEWALNQTKDSTFVRQTDAESQYKFDFESGILGIQNVCASFAVNAIVTPGNGVAPVHGYPCEYISGSIVTHEPTQNAGDPAMRDRQVTLHVDQTPFKKLLANSEFRGLTISEAFGDEPTLPFQLNQLTNFDVGNVFFYGKKQEANGAYVRANGASFSIDGAQPKVEMYLSIFKIDDHSATLRVHGLCVDPALADNFILFYFGGAGGNPAADGAKRTLYISPPGATRSFNGTTDSTNVTNIYQKIFYSDFYVTCREVVQNVAEIQIQNHQHDLHCLGVAVIAKRSTGMFLKESSSDPLFPDRENQLKLAEDASRSKGTIWNPKIRISQYLTAPLITPDMNNRCISPLDQTSMFLPPELRDFKMVLSDLDWSRLGPGYDVQIKSLTFSNFDGGNQQVGAIPSLLSIPEFQMHKINKAQGDFEITIFTPQGPPCFWCFYARSRVSPNWGSQPFIKSLSIRCITTGKHSNTVWETGDAELFFMTSRNCHFQSNYTAEEFTHRQVILLRSEDVGTMGISPVFYQNDKRVKYKISGLVTDSLLWEDDVDVSVVLVYINRGLHIEGKELTLRNL